MPESELALPFTDPVPFMAHGLLRKIAPWMLVLYRRRDAQELMKGNRFELLRWAELCSPRAVSSELTRSS